MKGAQIWRGKFKSGEGRVRECLLGITITRIHTLQMRQSTKLGNDLRANHVPLGTLVVHVLGAIYVCLYLCMHGVYV